MCIKNNNILTVCLAGSISKSTLLPVSTNTNKYFSTAVTRFSSFNKLNTENSPSTILRVNQQIKPYTVTGYFEGDGCFNLSVYKNPKVKTGYSVSFSAELKQNMQSLELLELIQKYFKGVGNINIVPTSHNKKIYRFKISKIKDMVDIVLPHFEKYPLLGSKRLNYLDFREGILLINSKEHLTLEGIEKLKLIIKKMNFNRTIKDKFDFCKTIYNEKKNKFLNQSRNNISQITINSNNYPEFLDGIYENIVPAE